MIVKVFIENEANTDRKNHFNEKTLEYRKTTTVTGKYSFPSASSLTPLEGMEILWTVLWSPRNL